MTLTKLDICQVEGFQVGNALYKDKFNFQKYCRKETKVPH